VAPSATMTVTATAETDCALLAIDRKICLLPV
jgi:hypothetical protein